jgi:hypothetical protein
MKKAIVLFFIWIASYGFGQQKIQKGNDFNPRSEKKVGYGFQFMGPTLFASFYMNYFINHQVNVEAGGGFLGYYGGAKFHLGKKEQKQLFSPYIGVNLGRISLPDMNFGWYGGTGSGWKGFFTVYLPVGIQLMNKNGFHFSVEGAWMYYTGSAFTKSIPYGAMRFGKNF